MTKWKKKVNSWKIIIACDYCLHLKEQSTKYDMRESRAVPCLKSMRRAFTKQTEHIGSSGVYNYMPPKGLTSWWNLSEMLACLDTETLK